MDFSVLLPQAPTELKGRLQRLINQSLETTGIVKKDLPLWRPDFYRVHDSPYWTRLSKDKRDQFLRLSSKCILKEAISIEHAGIAYANKMALLAESQEERQYYTTVAYEELGHLYLLQPYFEFSIDKDAPSFSTMIARVVEKESRRDSIILIQVLLEGWGISHYQSLAAGTDNIELKNIFSKIVFDETRHHGGGVILSQYLGLAISSELIGNIQSVIDAIRVGPYQVAYMLSHLNKLSSYTEVGFLLSSIKAMETTTNKLKIVQQNLGKILSDDQMQHFQWTPFSITDMSQIILNSLEIARSEDQPIEDAL
ncbi:MAG: ferritin-like domain-containing protein [Bdellovibrionaceae bacterium]|nr:ferritin-like domain-containing protein [Pseudobdellovibrionaceae bacterium]